MLVSYPVVAPPGDVPTALAARLTPAERDVAARLVRGASQLEIAAARGSSARTVSKQIQSVYRKLAVHSRSELAARCARGAGPAPGGPTSTP